ncbi:MAG: ParA family protein [Armatimonadota bacterium]
MGRTLIITGAYGSGKTECALALAARDVQAGPVTLVEMDFVTPYFRTLDHQTEMEALGVRVIAPDPAVAAIDAPSLPPTIGQALVHPIGQTIVDLGGDPAGAVVIGQFAPRLVAYDLWAVVNFSRPSTATPELAAALLQEVTAVTRLSLTGLVSNTHLGPYTTPEDILGGLAHAHTLGAHLGLPVVLLCTPAGVALPPVDLPVLTITPRLRRPWERVLR